MAQQSNRRLGLTYSEADLRRARENQEREPIRSAIARLETREPDPLAAAQMSALRGQLHQTLDPGYLAAASLNEAGAIAGDKLDLAGVKRAISWLAVAAMLRDHPAWEASWRDIVASTLERATETDDTLRQFWLGALIMAAGILLESDEEIARGAAVYRRAVERHIHPEGYFRGLTDIADGEELYEAQVSATGALVLLAEMAGTVGLELWTFESRAVSVTTAIAYTHFYYFFPEKWRWEADLTRERTAAIMRREGAFMELVSRRQPPQGIEQLLAEQRPLFCAWGGGLTTLTHGLAPEPKRRWRFW